MSWERHTCHATGCVRGVPPRLFMCPKHWYALPKAKQDAIWATYESGQEIRKDPSQAYLDAARDAIVWLESYELARRCLQS